MNEKHVRGKRLVDRVDMPAVAGIAQPPSAFRGRKTATLEGAGGPTDGASLTPCRSVERASERVARLEVVGGLFGGLETGPCLSGPRKHVVERYVVRRKRLLGRGGLLFVARDMYLEDGQLEGGGVYTGAVSRLVSHQ